VALDARRLLDRLGARRLVSGLLGQLVERLGVLQGAPGQVEVARRRLQLRLLLEQRLRRLVVRPEVGRLGPLQDRGGAGALPLDVKATPGAPPGAR